jgi:26S proteasome regulatory subunit RPN6 N-terminal domain
LGALAGEPQRDLSGSFASTNCLATRHRAALISIYPLTTLSDPIHTSYAELRMAVPPQEDAKRLEAAKKSAKNEPKSAEAVYKDILSRDPGTSDAAIRNFETALVGLGELYRDQKRVDDLADLIRQSRAALSSFARAKTAKLGMLHFH